VGLGPATHPGSKPPDLEDLLAAEDKLRTVLRAAISRQGVS